jgi:hypothetical protein
MPLFFQVRSRQAVPATGATTCEAVLSCLAVHSAASQVQETADTLATGVLMKQAVHFALGGAVLVAALTAWLAPGAITWYFNPPVATGGFSCTAPIA